MVQTCWHCAATPVTYRGEDPKTCAICGRPEEPPVAEPRAFKWSDPGGSKRTPNRDLLLPRIDDAIARLEREHAKGLDSGRRRNDGRRRGR